MDTMEIEEYKRKLEEIESKFTTEVLQKLTKEQLGEYVTLVTKIKARLEILENI